MRTPPSLRSETSTIAMIGLSEIICATSLPFAPGISIKCWPSSAVT
jgi:hypothetical protein